MESLTALISRKVDFVTFPYHSVNFSLAVSLVRFLLRKTVRRSFTRLYASSSFGYSSNRILALSFSFSVHLSRLFDSCVLHLVRASTSVSPFLSLAGSNLVLSRLGFGPRRLPLLRFLPSFFRRSRYCLRFLARPSRYFLNSAFSLFTSLTASRLSRSLSSSTPSPARFMTWKQSRTAVASGNASRTMAQPRRFPRVGTRRRHQGMLRPHQP